MTQEEIRTLLPDYVTGSLSEDERKTVELALAQSPELRAELEMIRTVFDRFPAAMLRRELEWRARNVRVHLSENSSFDGQRWRSVASLVAATATLAIVILTGVLVQRNAEPVQFPLDTPAYLSDKAAHQSNSSSPPRGLVAPESLMAAISPLSDRKALLSDSAALGVDAAALEPYIWMAYPESEIDSTVVYHFVEVFSNVSIE